MLPARDRITPGLDLELPQPGRGDGDFTAIPVGPLGELSHGRQRLAAAVRGAQHRAGPEHLVTFTEYSGADLECLTGYRANRAPAAVHYRLHVENGNPADHP